VIQRREFVRFKAKRPVRVYVGSERRLVQTFAVELAGGGLLLAGPDVLAIGEHVEFELSLLVGSEPVVGRGRVVRADTRGQRAITFSEMSELNRRRVVRFIFAGERAERRRMLQADERDGN
jgi:c-di-GMP-binding flagellar brake protein YcgR